MIRQKSLQSRREFLSDVGRGMVTAAVGFGMAHELGLAPVFGSEAEVPLTFGGIEPLVCLMQETPVAKLLPVLVESCEREWICGNWWLQAHLPMPAPSAGRTTLVFTQ